MKTATFILSILTLCWSLKTCSDYKSTIDKKTNQIIVTHNHQEEDGDSCLVSCICNCYGMSITYELIQPFTLRIHPEISTVSFSTYPSNYRFDFLSNIWQPPQLIG